MSVSGEKPISDPYFRPVYKADDSILTEDGLVLDEFPVKHMAAHLLDGTVQKLQFRFGNPSYINGMDHGTTQLLVDPYSIINAFLIDFRNKCPRLGITSTRFSLDNLKNESWIGVRLIFRDEARSASFISGREEDEAPG